jgi:hypothetical protein
MWQTFIILYLSYLILGPHWETRLIKGEKLRIIDSLQELGRRSIFISYMALLFVAWFLYEPSTTGFVSALMMSGAAAAGFYLKYGRETIPMHIFLVMFVLYKGINYMNTQLWLTLALLTFYTLTHEKLYIG